MLLTYPNLARWLGLAILAAALTALSACGGPVAAAQPDATPSPTSSPQPASTSTPVRSSTPALTPTWTPIPVAADSLRSAAALRGIYIGSAVGSGYLFSEPDYMQTLGLDFNMLTPETEMKFEVVEPGQGQFDFSAADKLVTFAQVNHMAVRGHVLVWHEAIPAWFANGQFDRDQSIQVLHNLIATEVGHFRGKVVAWDVVNEALYDDGGYRKSIWLDRIGPDYVKMAFRWAHQADPNALLFYNDYGIDDMNIKSTAVYRLLEELKHEGVPVDGVGLQMHIRGDYPPVPASVKANMQRFAALGLAVHITEMDVSTTYLKGTPDQQMSQQGQVYQEIAQTCLEVPACGALVVWGISDRHTWLRGFMGPTERPLLFDEDYHSKPAYAYLLAALHYIP